MAFKRPPSPLKCSGSKQYTFYKYKVRFIFGNTAEGVGGSGARCG